MLDLPVKKDGYMIDIDLDLLLYFIAERHYSLKVLKTYPICSGV